ncbi:MAG: Uma2 family endonuclease [Xanthobacteraceae bacterium]|nr:Uma2 family endonuclease [Xanthobacteraceae bacterium]
MDKAAFLAWAERCDERYELVHGRVVMMVGGTRAHWQIALNLAKALDARIDRQKWSVLPEFGVDAGPDTVRYPDIVVDPAGAPAKDLTARAPVLIAEVLSPSSERTDLADKAAEYLRLPSLATYIVVAQDEVKAWVWNCKATGFPAGPAVTEGEAGIVDIPSLGIELPLREIYDRVRLD